MDIINILRYLLYSVVPQIGIRARQRKFWYILTCLSNTYLWAGKNKFFENLMFCFLVKLIGVTNWLLWFDEKRKLRGKYLISVRNLATGNGNRNLKAARFKNRGKFFCQITTRDFSCSFNRWNSTGEDVWQN